mmetsp:Transcript_109669/g.291284  ORF Transcript_109669/g.291284 Transcript_109669/m.291284 type:complete len:255 (-) Transcript_109669:189-953(-)
MAKADAPQRAVMKRPAATLGSLGSLASLTEQSPVAKKPAAPRHTLQAMSAELPLAMPLPDSGQMCDASGNEEGESSGESDMSTDLKRDMESLAQQQAELAIAELAYGKLREPLGRSIENVRNGSLDTETVANFKTSMDESAALARKWYQSTVDLQKLVGYFCLMTQRGPVPEETKADFEKILLKQDRITSILDGRAARQEDQLSLLDDGKLTPQCMGRIEGILDNSNSLARQRLEKNRELQTLAGDAITKLAKQ